jgi:spore coat polysaccharide biosynthesis protein SpsF
MSEVDFRTEQEIFWVGDFGTEYIDRNNGSDKNIRNIGLFCDILRNTGEINSVVEYGANIGLNLKALKSILPNAEFHGVEINRKAYEILREWGGGKAYHQSILDFKPKIKFDFVFTKGVLIHINPDQLSNVYESLYRSSKKYICIIEYYNPTPVEVPYRRHLNKLFKRDFAGEILDIYHDLKLVSYGFVYHRDKHFPQDDLTWFLLKKK